MRPLKRVLDLRLLVTLFAAVLFLAWIALNAGRMASVQDGLIRFVLTAFFALLILLRPKRTGPAGSPQATMAPGILLAAALGGCLLALAGIILPVRQFEWIGLLLMLMAALEWSLPARFARDIPLALFLLYWAHPLPNPLFGWLQLKMQALSVAGSEWTLHLFNVRVWADGMVLRTAGQVFEIPAWCSGMRAATTMFILAWGMAILQRLRVFDGLLVALAALVQALALNIVRISLMVAITPGEVESNFDFLHDSAGIILVAGVALVYLEILGWRRLRAGQSPVNAAAARPVDPLSLYPPFWHRLLSGASLIASLALALLVLGATVTWKNRAFHRAEMIKGVAAGLREAGRLDEAQRAAEAVRRWAPGDREWHMEIIRLLVLRGRYEEALVELRDLQTPDPGMGIQRSILQAYSLMGLNRRAEAAAIVDKLPGGAIREDPRVAMVLAEIARYTDDPEKVAQHLVFAARWRPNQGRIRRLFPYLRSYRKWDAIAAADSGAPFADPAQAFSAGEACMNLNRPLAVAGIATQAMRDWPRDPRVLELLFFLAMRQPGSPWEDRFGEHLGRCVGSMPDVDALYALLEKCFQLTRPDLAWTLCRRIRHLDPEHPALPMSVTRYGSIWFTFRKHYLGMSAPSPAELTDLRQPLLALRGLQRPWFRWWTAQIPLADEILARPVPVVRQACLDRAILGFRKRVEAGTLSLAMQYEYACALEMARDFDTARRQLDKLAGEKPEQELQARIAKSEMLERSGDWQGVYETLRDFPFSDEPNLMPLIRLCRAQLRLRLGLAALHTAREATRLFPTSSLAMGTLADVLQDMGFPEDALFALSQPRPRRERNLDTLEVGLLDRTERFMEARRFRRSALLPSTSLSTGGRQRHVLPPAEWALLWHRTALPSERDFAAHAGALRRNESGTVSPFFIRMAPLWLKRYASLHAGPPPAGDDPGFPAELAAWADCGRDRFEKATALNQLTLFLCRQERWADARRAADAAVGLFPESGILQRILIGLSGADSAVVRAARERCPGDGEIWLASLVAGIEPPAAAGLPPWDEPAAIRHIAAAVQASPPRYTPAIMTRAGEYLLRRGMKKAAAIAAGDAVRRARGLLPAHILGVQAAVAMGDKPGAIECTRQAIDASAQPAPDLYLKMVELKTAEDHIGADRDLVAALEYLRRRQPAEALWAQMLGYVRFQRGDWEIVDSAYEMIDAIGKGATNRTPFLIGAEASRLFGNHERAIDLLRRGLAHHPDDVPLLNNLVYTLATAPTNALQAMEYVPRLLQLAPDSLPALDTAAVACIRAGRFDQAGRILADIQKAAAKGSPPWFRARLHEAEILARQAEAIPDNAPNAGEARKATRQEARDIIIATLRASSGVPDADVHAANQLISELDLALQPPRAQ